ncbi:DNA polymerase delta subunit 3 [Melipona quadrifasciata]|uniref:DNA polymerase delta subunit 3 n=1 Tax=Melipona quadrifasciata TaxID=166423 RepID=A0A0N0BL45_9HYME|nr:DNA polymerase delta subunit 3 [Melipona quadrifasciata]
MIMESLHEYLETVAGYIFDDDKLVTYKWLSKELEVHVNVAKQILWEFWQKYKEKKQFECVFLLMGHLHDDGMRVEIVKEKNLSTAKEKYSKIISKHVYSLQKTLPETQLLGLAEDGDVKFSGIKCIENNERNDEEMHMFRWGTASREIESTSREQVQSSVSEAASERKATSPEGKQVAKKKNADRKGFDNLFGKAVNKQKNPSASSNADKVEVDSFNHKRETSKNVSAEKKKNTQKGGLSNFLELGKNQTKTPADSLNKGKSANSSNKECANSFDAEKGANSLTKEATEEKVSKTDFKQIQTMRSKKRNRSKETNNAVKKRKRIAIQSDSSNSEPSDNENELELDLPLSPESSPAFLKDRSVSPPQVKHENGKRKVLKIVDKTFEEDGFLVTKKVHVYESCSEEEPEITEPKNEKKIVSESHSEVKGKKNTKQTTLMNFFKK